MCVIVVCPPLTYPDYDDLVAAQYTNDDGHGWAIRTRNGFVHARTLNAEEALDSFFEARTRHPDSWALWHSRWATQGRKTVDNVQPFRVPPHNQWVMAHNGVLSLDDGPFDERDRSDSRIFAEDILGVIPRWSDLFDRRDDVEWWLGGSKIVVMSAPKQKRHEPIIIYNERKGWWRNDGCWWSSLPQYARTTVFKNYPKNDEEDDSKEYLDWLKKNDQLALMLGETDAS